MKNRYNNRFAFARLFKILISHLVLIGSLIFFNNCSRSFQAVDSATAEGDFSSQSQLGPEILFTQEIPEVLNSRNISTAFEILNGSSDLKVQCQLNEQALQDCSSLSTSYSNLVDGDYVLKVNAESSGHKTTGSRKFRIDTTAPVVTVSQTPASLSGSTSASFVFTATDNLSGIAAIECALDTAGFSLCASPVQLTNLSAGSHTFKIRAKDKAGNLSLPYSYSWTVELAVPMVQLTSKPSSFTNSLSASFSFSGSEVISYECQLDNGAFMACSSPHAYASLSASAHQFSVRGKSSTGAFSSSVTYSWTIDQVAPSAPIVMSNVSSPSKINSASFSFSSTDASGITSYQCSIDSGNFATCTSPKAVTGLIDGAHSFRVKAVDVAGNESALSSINLIVDTKAPVLSFTQTPSSSTTLTTANFSFSVSDATSGLGSIQCSLDNAAFSTCSSPLSFSALLQSAHSFKVQAIDKAGNSSLITYNWSVTSGTQEPLPPITLKYPADTTMTPLNPPALARPAYLVPIVEPVFKTKVTRVTDPSAFGGRMVRHRYSKESVWNRDGSLMMITNYILDGKTYKYLKPNPARGEFRWSNLDPKKIFYLDSTRYFRSVNVDTGVVTNIRQFPEYDKVSMGMGEGIISNDDGYVAFAAQRGVDAVVIVLNIKTNTIESQKTFPNFWGKFDWVSISASGRYVVMNTSYCASTCVSGTLEVYDRRMVHVNQASNYTQHGDFAVDDEGNDVFVYVLGQTNKYITKTRLDTGVKTVLVKVSYGGHISCRSIYRRGWCYSSMRGAGYYEVFGFKLDGSGTVNRFAHHRSPSTTYELQPKAVVSMDGTKVIWTSDWNLADGSFYDYVAEMW